MSVDRLDEGANAEYARADDKRKLPAQLMSDRPDGKAGDKGTKLLQADCQRGVSSTLFGAISIVVLKGRQGEYTTWKTMSASCLDLHTFADSHKERRCTYNSRVVAKEETSHAYYSA